MNAANNILLIRPGNFIFNTETAANNAFQNNLAESQNAIQLKVKAEFDKFATTLKSKGVKLYIFNDTAFPPKPDAIFPNNWITFHPDGRVFLYPMFAPNRRNERRLDIIESLRSNFNIKEVIDLSHFESKNKFLEGTGSIVFDHRNKYAFACISPRTNKELFIKLCSDLGYKPFCFHAHDESGTEIYHTNVMMCIGEKFAVVCLDAITNAKERENIDEILVQSGHEIINISPKQMNKFAGNMLELINDKNEKLLIISQSAYESLTASQINTLQQYCELVPLAIPTIEIIGGGSVRCIIAEIFLKGS